MENSSMNLGDEIREESSVIRRSQSNSRGSLDIIPLHQARSDQAWFNTTPPCHSSFKILIPSLSAVALVKCQVMSLDPTVAYPLQTGSFVVAIFIYCLILWALKQSQNQSAEFLQFLCLVALASGVLSSLSVVSLLLPHTPGLLLLYASWALSTIISALPILQFTYNLLLTKTTSTIISALPILQFTYNWLLTKTKNMLNGLFTPAIHWFTRRTQPEIELSVIRTE